MSELNEQAAESKVLSLADKKRKERFKTHQGICSKCGLPGALTHTGVHFRGCSRESDNVYRKVELVFKTSEQDIELCKKIERNAFFNRRGVMEEILFVLDNAVFDISRCRKE